MPDSPEFRRLSLKVDALTLVRAGDVDGGIEKYRRYLDLSPNRELDDDAWASLGGAYRRKNDINKAIDCYRKAFEINPSSTYALLNLIPLCKIRNSPQDLKDLEIYIPKARQLLAVKLADSNNKEPWWTRYDAATLELLSGDVAASLSMFEVAADLTPRTARENFKSVLANLEFLHKHGIADTRPVIEKVRSYLPATPSE